MIAQVGWRSPFWAIAALGALCLLATWRLCPKCGVSTRRAQDRERSDASRLEGQTAVRETSDPTDTASTLQHLRGPALRSAAMPLAVSLLLVLANEIVFVVYGAWLEDQFGLSAAALGLSSTVIALAELVAEGAAAGLVDRIGKRRAVLLGLVANLLAYLLLPRLATTLAAALLGVGFMILTFEFSIVAMLPLVSELAPEARGTVMALNVAAMAAGRVIGSLSAARLWSADGLPLNAAVAAGVAALAVVILWLGVPDKQAQS
jgi:predicted MFS family arabinose efflux permease